MAALTRRKASASTPANVALFTNDRLAHKGDIDVRVRPAPVAESFSGLHPSTLRSFQSR